MIIIQNECLSHYFSTKTYLAGGTQKVPVALLSLCSNESPMKPQILICSLLDPQCPDSAWHTIDARRRFPWLFANIPLYIVRLEHKCPQSVKGVRASFMEDEALKDCWFLIC